MVGAAPVGNLVGVPGRWTSRSRAGIDGAPTRAGPTPSDGLDGPARLVVRSPEISYTFCCTQLGFLRFS